MATLTIERVENTGGGYNVMQDNVWIARVYVGSESPTKLVLRTARGSLNKEQYDAVVDLVVGKYPSVVIGY